MHEMKPRTNTPPAIKWLANEIAVMKGELDRIDAEVAHLAGRRAQVQAVLNALENVSAQVTLDTNGAEGRKICAGVVSEMATVTDNFAGKWKLKIFSPYSGSRPIAVCTLR